MDRRYNGQPRSQSTNDPDRPIHLDSDIFRELATPGAVVEVLSVGKILPTLLFYRRALLSPVGLKLTNAETPGPGEH